MVHGKEKNIKTTDWFPTDKYIRDSGLFLGYAFSVINFFDREQRSKVLKEVLLLFLLLAWKHSLKIFLN